MGRIVQVFIFAGSLTQGICVIKKMTNTLAQETETTLFKTHFSTLQDPRRTNKGNLQHLMSDILFLTISAMLCGITEWKQIPIFGKNQLDWLRRYGDFTNGIPSSDTLGRFFALLDPESFNECFIQWIDSIRKNIPGEIVPIDGKSIRGANPKKDGGNMPHIVSAFASSNGLCLGQVKVDQKSNEITAIPELLDLLALEGCVVTIDAMGCQTAIAKKIIDKGAGYIIAVKGNQGDLEQALRDTLRFEKPVSVDVEDDFGHGRIEKRTCRAYNDLSHIESLGKWKGLKTIAIIDTEICNKKSGITTKEQRMYISSLPPKAKKLNNAIRQHWAIENNLHWCLDVQFGEDNSRKRRGNAPENHSIMLKMAMTLLANDKNKKNSVRSKQLNAILNPTYRENLLKF